MRRRSYTERRPAGFDRGTMSDQLFVTNVPRPFDEPVAEEVLRELRARRGEDVRRRALADLERELVRSGEVVGRSGVDALEDLRQRRGREDGQARRRRLSARREHQQGEHDQRRGRAPHRSTITDVAFTTPVAVAAGPQAELLGRLASDDRDDPRRLRHVDLDLSEQAFDLDVP